MLSRMRLFQFHESTTVSLKGDPTPASKIRFVDDKVWVLGSDLQVFDENLVQDSALTECFSSEGIVDVLQLPNDDLLAATGSSLVKWKPGKNVHVDTSIYQSVCCSCV